MQTVSSSDGTRIAYDQTGTGPALILVDGAMCHRAFGPMPALVPLLAPHFTVITYDRRGRNESTDNAPYAVEREIEDLAALIALAGGSAFVYGISSGAALALLATASGLPVTGLALYEPPYRSNVGDAERNAAVQYRDQMNELSAAGRRGDMVRMFMTLVGTPSEAIEGMSHSPMWPMFEAVAPTLSYDAAIMGDNSVPIDRAATVTVPTLVAAGGASPEWFRVAAHELAEAIPDHREATLDGQTHEVDPTVLAPRLIAFFSERVAASAT